MIQFDHKEIDQEYLNSDKYYFKYPVGNMGNLRLDANKAEIFISEVEKEMELLRINLSKVKDKKMNVSSIWLKSRFDSVTFSVKNFLQSMHDYYSTRKIMKKPEKRGESVRQVNWEEHREELFKMQYFLESFFTFSNMLLDAWAAFVNEVLRLNWKKASFAEAYYKHLDYFKNDFEDKDVTHKHIIWLFYNVRAYRNTFVTHVTETPVEVIGSSWSSSKHMRLRRNTTLSDKELLSKIDTFLGNIVLPAEVKNKMLKLRKNPRFELLPALLGYIDYVDDKDIRKQLGNCLRDYGTFSADFIEVNERLMRFLSYTIGKLNKKIVY